MPAYLLENAHPAKERGVLNAGVGTESLRSGRCNDVHHPMHRKEWA
jgi:hypothetical protein